MAAGALREERQAAAGPDGRPGRGPVLRRPRARPGRAGHHVDAGAAADDEHDGADRPGRRPDVDRGVLRRPGAQLHAAGVLRPAHRLALAPARHPRLAARARHVGGRGPHPPLPDQGAGRAAADLPAVLRALHPDGPGRQLDAGHRQAEVRPQAGRPVRRDDRLPAPLPRRTGRRGVRRRRGEHAVQEPRGLRRAVARHREHPRHPAGHQGTDGPAAALAAGRRPGRHGAAVDRGAGPRRAPGDPHPRQQRRLGDAAGGRRDQGDDRGRRARRPQPGRPHARGQRHARPSCSTCASRCSTAPGSCPTTSTCAT